MCRVLSSVKPISFPTSQTACSRLTLGWFVADGTRRCRGSGLFVLAFGLFFYSWPRQIEEPSPIPARCLSELVQDDASGNGVLAFRRGPTGPRRLGEWVASWRLLGGDCVPRAETTGKSHLWTGCATESEPDTPSVFARETRPQTARTGSCVRVWEGGMG